MLGAPFLATPRPEESQVSIKDLTDRELDAMVAEKVMGLKVSYDAARKSRRLTAKSGEEGGKRGS